VEKVSDLVVDVARNDEITLNEAARYEKIMLSPGPGLPSEAGIMPELLKELAPKKSILGVCLGLQAIGENFGCPLRNLNTVYHGVAGKVFVTGKDDLFRDCPSAFTAGRYHSWVIDENRISPQLEVTAVDENKLVMAAKHRHYNVRGVQFHPESILSEYGETIIRNWLLYG
jgi:anthranilate synthase component 2